LIYYNVNASVRRTLHFQNVNAHDIIDRMAIRVASVNGIPAATAARDGVLQVRAVSRNDFTRYDNSFRFVRGEIQGFANNAARVADLVIPNTIWGDPIVSIGADAFRNAGLTSVTIPGGVISIGANAFANNSLTSVTIPDGVISIGANAFANNSLTSVTIPNSVTSVGPRAFDGRVRITRGVPSPPPTTPVVAMFRFAGGEIQGFYGTVPANLVIPDTILGNRVISIGADAFRNAGLTSVTIPDSVTYIGANAFANNPLSSVSIPSTLTLPHMAFGPRARVTRR